ncbi:RING finger protein 17 isoform X2 [Pangasianodon hypophthalmus]|uniref:RING finger protein 17 isoform X2 n=1 Tax=Pangasianodon hypophthalmus TaxID=310915 RepID=UPI00230769C8|nr:RING finger protein 17 isoform X2 [Pangasianodon hypophthalmus]
MMDAAVTCNNCGLPYTLSEDEVVGRLPHVLFCGHIFCVECLRSLECPQDTANSVSSISCPECTMSTEIGEEGVDGLQVDSRIIGLIYTAKMNSKRRVLHGGVRQTVRRLRSPAAHPSTHMKLAEEGPDVAKILNEALCKATENLTTLDSLHQTLVAGIQSQLKKERNRIIKEIDECIDKAVVILQRRRSALMSELSCLEKLFSAGREECQKLQVRRRELRTAIQKARHVRQVPLLETYCHLDEILETLQSPVDTELYDMSCLTMRSGLGCILNVDHVKNCLEITDGNFKLVCEEVAIPPATEPVKRPVRSGGSGERRGGRDSPRVPISPRPASPKHIHAPSPNVIIEEIIEETVAGDERDVMGQEPKPTERQRVQRKNRKALPDRITASQSALQKWVAVTHIINPTHFYVRYVMERKAGVLLARKINSICSGEQSHFTVKDQIKTGALVFVKWKNDVWCRAVVCELIQKGCLECVTHCSANDVARLEVFFLDYGFSKGLTISGDDLVGLNECVRRADSTPQADLHRWAPQAIRCSLKDIIPSDLVKGWSREASEEMKRVIGSSVVEMQVLGEERDTLLVDLKKVSMNTSLSLREHLVYMELARFYSPQVAPAGNKTLLFYPPVYPKLNTELNAVVSHVNTPSDFYIQLVDNMEFLLLNTKLQNCYGLPGVESDLQIYSPVLSQACVALYDNKDWCRAQVTGFPGGRLVEVQYVDFGNRETLSVKDLRQIKDEFFALPAMALWCSLDSILSVGETWSEESIDVFRKLTEQKLVTVVAKGLVPVSMAMPVCLFEVSEHSTECLSSIGEILVTKGLASLSKQVSPKKPVPLEHTVWDPPLVEEGPSQSEPTLPTLDPSALQPSLILPACLKDVKVKVTHVTSPGNICVQLLQYDTQLKRIHDLLKKEYSKSEPQEIVWKAKMPCAANVNGIWERGKVCNVSSSNVAEVLRCDFGNKVNIHLSNLRPLLPELSGSFLLECCLSDIRPAGGCSTWTATACDFISYYLTGAMAIMTIKEPSSVRPVPVSLFCSNRAGRHVSIADFLIAEGLALRERSVKPAPKSESDLCDNVGCALGETVPLEEETACEESGQRSKSSAPSHTPSPKPAPRITPPPERVRTQAYLPTELPPCGDTRMSISAVSDDGVIHVMTLQAACEFERLQEQLQQHIKTLPRQKHYNWKNVLGCVVMGSDMLWYRGQVQEVIGGYLKVRYVDQGIVENIPVCHVYPMVLCENVPQLCVPCQINGILPVGGTWQWDAVALMKELLLGRMVSVHVIELPDDPRGLVTVEIILDGMPLSKIMMHHQHATFSLSVGSPEDYVVKPPVPDLDDWDLNTEGLEEPQTMLGVYTDLKLPDKGMSCWIKIKHIRTPNEVFLSVLDTPVYEQEQESLDEALSQVNSDIDSLPLLTDFPIEGPCLAEYSDGKYYRAKLLGFSELNPSIQLLVRHVDFGSDDILPLCKLRCLPKALLRFPCEAVCVQLAGFKPPHLCQETERIPYRPEWSMKAMLEMIDLLHGKLRSVVTAVEPQPTVLLYNADGTLVHTPLVEKGLADYE